MARYFIPFSIIHTYIFIRKGTFSRAKTRPVNPKTLDFFFQAMEFWIIHVHDFVSGRSNNIIY
jgi:hypothetical protein